MPRHPSRLPVAGRDAILDADTALRLLRAAVSDAPAHQTVGCFLDARHRGTGLLTVISGTEQPDDVLAVAEVLSMAVGTGIRGDDTDPTRLVLASFRPDGADDPLDGARWVVLDATTRALGVELVDWFVVGPGSVHHPRERAGVSSRWPGAAPA